MAQDLELPGGIVGEPDAIEVEVDDAPGVEAGGGEKGHREKREG
jgi:hypothetical protein